MSPSRPDPDSRFDEAMRLWRLELYQEALAELDRAEEAYELKHLTYGKALCQLTRGRISYDLFRLDEAEDSLESATALFLSGGMFHDAAFSAAFLAQLRAEQGRPKKARAVLASTERRIRRAAPAEDVANALVLLAGKQAEICRLNGEPEQGLKILERAYGQADRAGRLKESLQTLWAKAVLLRDLGRHDESDELVRYCLERTRAHAIYDLSLIFRVDAVYLALESEQQLEAYDMAVDAMEVLVGAKLWDRAAEVVDALVAASGKGTTVQSTTLLIDTLVSRMAQAGAPVIEIDRIRWQGIAFAEEVGDGDGVETDEAEG